MNFNNNQTGQISVDSDRDSAYGDSGITSETSSLRSEVFEYVYENGRRYHSYRQGAYWGPNDEQAQDNLDLYNHIFAMSLNGRLYLAPIDSHPQRVLDIGTGTGIWAMDFADAHPSASVSATDLSPIQPDKVPPNLEFFVDDFTAPWTFAPQQSTSYMRAISVVARSPDDSTKGTYAEKYSVLALESKAGSVNVVYQTFKWPMGTWPKNPKLKQIGAYNRIAFEDGVEGWTMHLFTNYLGWQREEVQVFIAGLRRENRDPKIHGYQNISICYGQRPSHGAS
ncbi:hypothetical protein EJ08DRAFT_671167 [Tothia fuscella]|uniref:Methyltransferase n=1 Tax=Tothia fuscella TaxID=1048955 RepID=A0A9P4NPG3_9PEZI|nr:hypothetical protein EJ08DRAFT_671167 [Tothia fuscella]